jgi:hypothetical protein
VVTKGIGDVPVPQVGHPLYNAVVEVKSHRRASTAERLKAWKQATAAAEETGKHPLVVETFIDGGKRTFWLVQKLEWPTTEESE